MARTYTSTNLRCASTNCNSRSVFRVICYECERCYHTGCVDLEDKDFKIFLCAECNAAMKECEENARERSARKNEKCLEKKNSDTTAACTSQRCMTGGVCCCNGSNEKHVSQPDISCEPSNKEDEVDDDTEPYIDVLKEEDKEVPITCSKESCTTEGKYTMVCKGCEKHYHSGCVKRPNCDPKNFWCDECCQSTVDYGISFLDISSIASKIDELFISNVQSGGEASENGGDSRPEGQESTTNDQNPPAQQSSVVPYDPFINDPDLVNYDPVLGPLSYDPSLGPGPSTEEEINAWRERVREAELEIQQLEMRMQKARVIDRNFYGTFQETVSREMLGLYRTTPCDAQFCEYHGRFRVMCERCLRMFHTGCLSLPDYDFETTICFYCPLSDQDSDQEEDDDAPPEFFMDLHL